MSNYLNLLKLTHGRKIILMLLGAILLFWQDEKSLQDIKNDMPIDAVYPDSNRHHRLDSTDAQFCAVEDLKEGKWIPVTYASPPYFPHYSNRVCSGFDPNSEKPFETWEWQPSAVDTKGCVFSGFHKESYCELMRNKTIAIIGDSTSFDHYLSVSHLLDVPMELPQPMKVDPLSISEVCEGTSKLIGQKDMDLHTVGDIVTTFSPDVLVLNRGLHYAPDDELVFHINQTIVPQLEEWRAKCIDDEKSCLLIWRTTSPGHPNCIEGSTPSSSIEEMEELVQVGSKSGKYTDWHWDDLTAQNSLVTSFFKMNTTLEVEVMDGYHLQVLRPDSHNPPEDCLHTCAPHDTTYAWLLHHMLQVKYNVAVELQLL